MESNSGLVDLFMSCLQSAGRKRASADPKALPSRLCLLLAVVRASASHLPQGSGTLHTVSVAAVGVDEVP